MNRNPFNDNAIIICETGKQESFKANNILKTLYTFQLTFVVSKSF
jgi:hypothetical protein